MTKYTEQEKQNLSRKVAEKHNVSPINAAGLWLHEDWHGAMELCVKHGVFIEYDGYDPHIELWAHYVDKDGFMKYETLRIDDCASPSEAERIARLLALGEL